MLENRAADISYSPSPDKEVMMITVDEVKKNHKLNVLIETAHRHLGIIGYTEHGFRHAAVVSQRAGKILAQMGKDKRLVELAKIAGFMHDCGNSVNRNDHAHTAAILAYDILNEMGMPIEDVAEVIGAIGNHHETYGLPVSDIAAALIIADKSDVDRSRVRKTGDVEHDIHDRVNYAVHKSNVIVKPDSNEIEIAIIIDQTISSVMEYFETFLGRMQLCRKACAYFEYNFELVINGVRLS